MTTLKIEGTTLENSVAAQNLVVAYKADRSDPASVGEELGRVTADVDGGFVITFDDWFGEVFVVAIDPTTGTKYDSKIIDWIVPTLDNYDPYFDDIVCLYRMEGADAANSFVDEIGNTTAVAFGGVTTSVDQVKFGSTAAKFVVGNVDSRIEITHAGELNIVADDACIELFVYFNTLSGLQTVLTNRNPLDSTDYTYDIYADGTTLRAYFATDLDGGLYSGDAGTLSTLQWHHIALVRDGDTIRVFLDGTQTATMAASNYSLARGNSYPLLLGYDTQGVRNLDGFEDSLRFTVGAARYTENFDVPTSDYPTDVDGNFNDVKLLLHMQGVDGGTVFTDVIGNTVTAVGAADTSTDQVKFGTSSLHIPSSVSRLTVPHNSEFSLGLKDFTLECWIYIDGDDGNYKTIFSKRPSTAVYGEFLFRVDPSEQLQLYLNNSSSWVTCNSPNGSVPVSEWVHVAYSRNGSIIRGYVNGVQVAQTLTSLNVTADTNDIVIGSLPANQNPFDGYMVELRLTVGTGRYPESFSPPTKPFQDS